MADLEALKRKYAPVIAMIEKFVPYGATLQAVDLAGEQLHIRGTVPSKVVLERVWDQIKKADPTYSDLKHEIGTTGGDTQPVTIKHGALVPASWDVPTLGILGPPHLTPFGGNVPMVTSVASCQSLNTLDPRRDCVTWGSNR